MPILVTIVEPDAVTFPDGQTTLEFEALADPEDRRVNVTYTITSPASGVTFDNNTKTESLNDEPVPVGGTRVSKAVRFVRTSGSAPTIEVAAVITEIPGGDTQDQSWVVPVKTGKADLFTAAADLQLAGGGLTRAQLAHAQAARGVLQVLLMGVETLLENEGRLDTPEEGGDGTADEGE